MRNELRPLPVTTVPIEAEGGLGYLMRMARHNGLTLPVLLKWAGVSSMHDMSLDGVRVLAYVGEIPSTWLAYRLVHRLRAGGRTQRAWMGQVWSTCWSLRAGRAQVCPACLRELRFCSAAWEMTGAFVCLRHRQLLVDRCAHCRRVLTWYRPDVDVCECGRYLSGPPSETCPSLLVDWVALVHARLYAQTPRLLPRPEWPAWLVGMSAEGLSTLIHALGIHPEPLARVRGGTLRSVPSVEEMSQIVQRGLMRLPSLNVPDDQSLLYLKDAVYEQGLERLARIGSTLADRDIAERLLDRICRPPKNWTECKWAQAAAAA